MIVYMLCEEDFAKLRELQAQLDNGTDRERDYGHRLWLVLNNAVCDDLKEEDPS